MSLAYVIKILEEWLKILKHDFNWFRNFHCSIIHILTAVKTYFVWFEKPQKTMISHDMKTIENVEGSINLITDFRMQIRNWASMKVITTTVKRRVRPCTMSCRVLLRMMYLKTKECWQELHREPWPSHRGVCPQNLKSRGFKRHWWRQFGFNFQCRSFRFTTGNLVWINKDNLYCAL